MFDETWLAKIDKLKNWNLFISLKTDQNVFKFVCFKIPMKISSTLSKLWKYNFVFGS